MDVEQKLQQLTGKVSDLFFGLKLIVLLFIFVVSVGNVIVAALSIDHFESMYRYQLPGKPLPEITVFVLDHRSLLYFFSLGLPVIGVAAMFIRERTRLAIILMTAVLFIVIFQTSLTITALQLPYIPILGGMSKINPSEQKKGQA